MQKSCMVSWDLLLLFVLNVSASLWPHCLNGALFEICDETGSGTTTFFSWTDIINKMR